ncbi:MAG TPA: hypothetical protein VHE61_04200 [Opitutaceae bacterium]|nr:hypothetical protein [Opitutaceae bacterium]
MEPLPPAAPAANPPSPPSPILGGSRLRWLVLGVVACALLPLFFSWPATSMSKQQAAVFNAYWEQIVELKIANPLFDYRKAFEPGKNEAKRNFRLTVPLLARVTGTGITGVTVIRYALQLALLVALLLAAERACRDRLIALAVALAVAGTTVGTEVWRDLCLWFDNCAHAFMALALVATSPWAAGATVFLAALTDERALLGVPLLMVFHLAIGSRRSMQTGMVAGALLYVAVRAVFAQAMGFMPPLTGVAEHDILATNIASAPLGYWAALEGGWLLVGYAVWRLHATGRTGMALGFAALALLPIVASTAVGDFTRSASYGFAATLAALAVVCRPTEAAERPLVRRLAIAAGVVSLLIPNVNVMRYIAVEQCLPVHAVVQWLDAHP